MSKNIYSLVLTDDVVAALDRAAYEAGLSRSAMANKLLADVLSCPTAEQRIRDIFELMGRSVGESGMPERLRISQALSDSAFQLRSVLSYKYNPTLRYTVELCEPVRLPDGLFRFGRLRVSLRTRNDLLSELFDKFVALWNWAESINNVSTGLSEGNGRYVRDLLLDEGSSGTVTDERFAEAVLAYIRLMDDCLETFFRGLDSEASTAFSIENKYERFLTGEAFLFR